MTMLRKSLFLFVWGWMPLVHAYSQDIGTIYDAVFSPDGQTIGVGTSTGFHRFECSTMKYIDSIETEGGVHFILWSPNGNQVLLSHWENDVINDSTPTYSLFDRNKKCIFSRKINVRYFIDYRPGDINTVELFVEQNYPSRNCPYQHYIQFSSDSSNISFLSQNNTILIHNTTNGELIDTIDMIEDHIISFGYFDHGDRMWFGTLLNSMLTLSFDDRKVEKIENTMGENFFITNDCKYSLSIYNAADIISPALNSTLYLYSLTERNKWYVLSSGRYYYFPKEFYFSPRLIFLPKENKMKILYINGSIGEMRQSWGSHEFDLNTMSIAKEKLLIDVPIEGFLLQPFSPDGEEFLHLYQGKLYIYNTDTLEGKQILPSASSVSGFEKIRDNKLVN